MILHTSLLWPQQHKSDFEVTLNITHGRAIECILWRTGEIDRVITTLHYFLPTWAVCYAKHIQIIGGFDIELVCNWGPAVQVTRVGRLAVVYAETANFSLTKRQTFLHGHRGFATHVVIINAGVRDVCPVVYSWKYRQDYSYTTGFRMMSWHGYTFHISCRLWGESNGDRWFPLTKGQ